MNFAQRPPIETKTKMYLNNVLKPLTGLLGIIMPTSSVITLPLSTLILLLPPISRSEIENVFPPRPMPHIHFKPNDTVEDLQVYHSYLDKLNDMFSPDPDVTHWTPETILSHHVQHVCDGEKRRVYMKIQVTC